MRQYKIDYTQTAMQKIRMQDDANLQSDDNQLYASFGDCFHKGNYDKDLCST